MKTKTIEDYVELVYELEKTKKPVRTNDVALALDINPASITEIFQKLDREGYVNYERYEGVTLTKKGKRLAILTKKRHEKLVEFLVLLGIEKKIAEKDACEMEHILNPKTMDAIVKFVDIVTKCSVIPFWLSRLRKYIKTGKLDECPQELFEICLKYNR